MRLDGGEHLALVRPSGHRSFDGDRPSRNISAGAFVAACPSGGPPPYVNPLRAHQCAARQALFESLPRFTPGSLPIVR